MDNRKIGQVADDFVPIGSEDPTFQPSVGQVANDFVPVGSEDPNFSPIVKDKYAHNPEIDKLIQQRSQNYIDVMNRNSSAQEKVMNQIASMGFGSATTPIVQKEELPNIFEHEGEAWDWIRSAKTPDERKRREKAARSAINAFEANISPMIDPVEIAGMALTGGLSKGIQGGVKQVAKNIFKEGVSQTTFGLSDFIENAGKGVAKKLIKEAATPDGQQALRNAEKFLQDSVSGINKPSELFTGKLAEDLYTEKNPAKVVGYARNEGFSQPISGKEFKESPKVLERLTKEELQKSGGSLYNIPAAQIPYMESQDIYMLSRKIKNRDVEVAAPYVNRLAERLGQDETKQLIQKNAAKYDRYGETELVKDLADTLYKKEKIGNYGSVTKVVNNSKVIPYTKIVNDVPVTNVVPTMEIVEAEMNVLKKLPTVMKGKEIKKVAKDLRGDIVKKAGLYEPPIRSFDDLGESMKAMTYDKAREATHLSQLGYKESAKGIDDFKLTKIESQRVMAHALLQEGQTETLKRMGVKAQELSPKEMAAYKWMRNQFDDMADRFDYTSALAGKPPLGQEIKLKLKDMPDGTKAYMSDDGKFVRPATSQSKSPELSFYNRPKNYFTLSRQLEDAEKEGFNVLNAQYDTLSDFIKSNTTEFAYKKHRVKSSAPVELDAVNVFKKYMARAHEYVNMSPVITRVNKMNSTLFDTLEDGTKKAWRLQDENPRASEFLNNWTKDLQGFKWKTKLGGEEFDKLDRFANVVNRNILYSTLSGNMKSFMTQIFGTRNAFTALGPDSFLKGWKQNLDKGYRKFALQNSNVLGTRVFEHGFDKAGNIIGKTRDEIAEKGLIPLKRLDMETAQATWLGAFDKAYKKQGLNMKDSIGYADNIVTKTQGSATRVDRIPLARTPAGRMVSLFQTFGSYDYSFLKKDVLGLGTNIPKSARAKTFMKYAAATEALNIAAELSGMGSPFPNPYKTIKDSADNGDSGAITILKTIEDLASVHPALGSAKYGKSIVGAPISSIEEVIEKMNKGKELPWDVVAQGAAKVTGIPGMGWIPRYFKIKELGGNDWEALLGKYPKKKKNTLGDL